MEAASLAWMPLGWEAAWFSEIEPFPCAVLKERFPNVPNLGDMTKIEVENMENGDQKFSNGNGADVFVPGGVDLLVGGTPCQSFSVAGKREGLDGASGLAKSFVELLGSMRPRWFVWENVPGCLSSINKRTGVYDFNFLLAAFAERGYSLCWRILDAQYVRVDGYPRAVPQRRRRVFVVGHYSADWRYPASVLFEPDSLFGYTPPRRTKRQNASAGSEGGSASTDWWDGSQKAGTLTRTSDQQFMPDKGRLQCVIEQAGTDFLCYENHAPDSRIKSVEVSQSIVARMGTGGNNLPLLQEVPRDPETAIGFIKNDAGCDLQGFWDEVFPTMRTEVTPAVAREECFHVSFCDANGRRKDRPNGGLYVTEAKAGKTVTAGGPGAETVIVEPIALDGDKMKPGERSGGSGMGFSEDGVMYTQTVKDVHAVAYDECVPLDLRNATRDPEKHDAQNRQGVGIGEDGAPMNTVTAASVPGVGWQATVRKLLPIECERLMGFPDNWTRISWKGKPEEECPDAPRYKACGNSMCVNVMRWIGMRIEIAERKSNA